MRLMKRVGVLILALAAAVNAGVTPQTTVKVGVDLVNVLFTVTDRNGHLISGLNLQDFLIEEDGRKQDIQFFSRENELPLTLGMVVDTSPSVRPVFDQERATANRFLEQVLRPKDLAMLIAFDKSVTLFQDFTDDIRRLQRAYENLELGPSMNGGTSLYDALYLATREKLKNEAGRKAIVLISDGDDTTSKIRIDEALMAIHESDTVVYSLAVGGNWPGFRRYRGGSIAIGNHGSMKRLSEETGGTYFDIDNRRDLNAAFARINDELRNQYSIGYVSLNPAKDGKFRRIKIIPRDATFRIQARKGYYAAKRLDSQ